MTRLKNLGQWTEDEMTEALLELLHEVPTDTAIETVVAFVRDQSDGSLAEEMTAQLNAVSKFYPEDA